MAMDGLRPFLIEKAKLQETILANLQSAGYLHSFIRLVRIHEIARAIHMFSLICDFSSHGAV